MSQISKFDGLIICGIVMKKIAWCFILIIVGMQVRAQQEYFVFIQEPGGQPFYVRMGEHSYSSSAGGHLILSSLKDSVYSMYIGFPKMMYPELLFNVAVKNKDRGFELKKVNGRWQLDDLRNLQVIQPEESRTTVDSLVKKSDGYSQLMAGVVNDTAVLYGRPPQPDSAALAAANTDSAAKGNNTEVAVTGNGANNPGNRADVPKPPAPVVRNKPNTTAVAATNTAAAPAAAETNTATPPAAVGEIRDSRDIIRYRTENIREGKLMIYLDRSTSVTDTIRLIIPRL